MKVLVTGGTGFLGEKLAMRLQNLGHQVTVVGRNQQKGKILSEQGIDFVPLDLGDEAGTISVCQGQDFIFHCAALSAPWGKYEEFYRSNLLSTRHLIRGSQEAQVQRFIHVSTPSIYFDYQDREKIREDAPLPAQPVNYYAATKRMAEEEVDQAHEQGLPVITIRPRALFGPGDTTILPRLIRANQKFIPLIQGGQAIIDVTYVENVVDALLLCMDSAPDTLGEKYNITNGEPVQFITLLEKLFSKLDMELKTKVISFERAYRLAGILEWISTYLLFGKEPVLTQYSVGVLGKTQTLDISKAQRELGYQAQVSIDQGLDLFVDWLKGAGSWILK